MRTRDYRVSKTMKALKEMKHNGKKFVIWSLPNKEVKAQVEKRYNIVPWIFEIKTRTFSRVATKPTLIKDVHYAKKRCKDRMSLHLENGEISLLEEYDVQYRVVKYMIILKG